MTRHILRTISAVFLLSLLFACTETSDPSETSDDAALKEEISSQPGFDGGKADIIDPCITNDWYSDGECDTFCHDTDPDCANSDICVPVCDAIGSKGEGWYHGCTGVLIAWAHCEGCTASCAAVGTRSEGWYDSCDVGINGTGLIGWDQCASTPSCPLTGVVCSPDCGDDGTIGGAPCNLGIFDNDSCVCEPIDTECHPICNNIGTKGEGWYDSCSGDLIGWSSCAGCESNCLNGGTRSEGWYDSCGVGYDGTGLIMWTDCVDDDALPTCPLTGVPCIADCPAEGTLDGMPCQAGNFNEETCTCEPIDQQCTPICNGIGSRGEGWYDSCTNVLIGWASCEGCTASCGAINTRGEGWYDSCGVGMGISGDGLITWAECGE